MEAKVRVQTQAKEARREEFRDAKEKQRRTKDGKKLQWQGESKGGRDKERKV